MLKKDSVKLRILIFYMIEILLDRNLVEIILYFTSSQKSLDSDLRKTLKRASHHSFILAIILQMYSTILHVHTNNDMLAMT